ncbi:ATP-binding protein [Mycolicibacterium cosmeticum]|nr:ATP-binding protein [Mycolicibacterium cosmeticum]
MTVTDSQSARTLINQYLATHAGISALDVHIKDYPNERNYIVFVAREDLGPASALSEPLEQALASPDQQSFVVFRVANEELTKAEKARTSVKSLSDPRISELVSLVSARSRVSAADRSLGYVPDVRASLSAVTAGRHHLIFGRRGAGKTALLVEAKSDVELRGAVTAWINIQTYRHEEPQRVVLYTLSKILGSLIASRKLNANNPASITLSNVHNRILSLLDKDSNTIKEVELLIPRVQGAISHHLELTDSTIFVFLDDFYYVKRDFQPTILDLLHAITRDSRVWLKVASIKHLTRWWLNSPPTGLQTGQDAEIIDLDVSLQDPKQAQGFLETVLAGYGKRVGISSLSQIFSRAGLDRLVLASGAVPRDYLVLAASAVTRAQQRPSARQVGVQEINQAAGDAAATKINELEEDMASNPGAAEKTIESLKVVRKFCLEKSSHTYFLVSFHDKEDNPLWYGSLTDLMDVRLIHLVDAGVSDAHSAGHRYEAYMLDLSQFSGARLKQRIRVLDFSSGSFVSRQTRGKEPPRVGSTSSRLRSILRAAPQLELKELENVSLSQSDRNSN